MERPEERRVFRRVTSQFNVRISRDGARGDGCRPADIARSINISASGMLVAVDDDLNVRDIVRLTFVKPNSLELFEGSARVVRTSRIGGPTSAVALAFLDLSESEVSVLDLQISMPA